jgi:hypothetical protein
MHSILTHQDHIMVDEGSPCFQVIGPGPAGEVEGA